MAMQMQSFLATPVASFATGSRSRVTGSFGLVPRTGRQAALRVKCMAAEEGPEVTKAKVESPSPSSSNPSPTMSTPNPIPTPKPQPKVSTKFGDLFAFSGPAPERINGRLAPSFIHVKVGQGKNPWRKIIYKDELWAI